MQSFDNWAAVEANAYVIGDFVWTSLDYLGEAGLGRLLHDDADTSFLGSYPWLGWLLDSSSKFLHRRLRIVHRRDYLRINGRNTSSALAMDVACRVSGPWGSPANVATLMMAVDLL
jgi:hypothetical protein